MNQTLRGRVPRESREIERNVKENTTRIPIEKIAKERKRERQREYLLWMGINIKTYWVEADTLPLVNSDSISIISLEFTFVWLLRKS